jgi:hypothetical protein
MPTLTFTRATSTRAGNFRETNRQLSHWLDRLAPNCETAEPGQQPSQPRRQQRALSPDCITALLSELVRVGAVLRAEPLPSQGTDPELDCELDHYRGHVERLRQILPSIYNQLLVERARLEAQRARVSSAAEWARASRQTL